MTRRLLLPVALLTLLALALTFDAASSERTGHARIYVVNLDGSGRRSLTTNNVESDRPALSRNGRALAFERDWVGVGIISPNGRNERELIRAPHQPQRPAWSRDGAYIAFTNCASESGYERCSIGVVRRDGTDLTWIPDASYPTWTTGRRLAYLTDVVTGLREGPQSIAIANVDGSDRRIIARTSEVSAFKFLPPVAAPSGTRIAFVAERDGVDFPLYTLDLRAGSLPERLAPNASDLAWAPNGRRLVFSNAAGMWTVRSDGSHLRRVPSVSGANSPHRPSWSPDGTRIAFVNRPRTKVNLVVMNLHTRTSHILARNIVPRLPLWSRDGRSLYYVAWR